MLRRAELLAVAITVKPVPSVPCYSDLYIFIIKYALCQANEPSFKCMSTRQMARGRGERDMQRFKRLALRTL